MDDDTERSWTGTGWSIQFTQAGELKYESKDTSGVVRPSELAETLVAWSWFRWSLRRGNERLLRLRGLKRGQVAELRWALRLASLAPDLSRAVAWRQQVRRRFDESSTRQRWLPRESVEELERQRPDRGLAGRLHSRGLLERLTLEQLDAVQFLETDLQAVAKDHNERITQAELRDRADFLATIEKSPLTEEQSRAVICFDNRVLLLAAAGSGKTSAIVARAAYAVERGFVAPERILLLAFNKNAAKEMQGRIRHRLGGAGISAEGIQASTFHSFGLRVIAEATGEKPRLARWVDEQQTFKKVMEIVDLLGDRDPAFRKRWDMYRLLYGRAPSELIDDSCADAQEPSSKQPAYRTYDGKIVRSHSERMIADWLFYNGVKYEYERDYIVNTATAEHAQYRPDFYYPDSNVWHEHWGVDRDGNPPKEWVGYLERMRWKRQLHAKNGTALVESTFGEIMDGVGFAKLEQDLSDRGIAFEWNADRVIPDRWSKPLDDRQLAKLVRTFMAHVKGSGADRDQLYARIEEDDCDLPSARARAFLDLYWSIHDEWERQLEETRSIDFEDMLVQAAEHLSKGRYASPYELVLVDELQDASRARARLVEGLLREPGRFLLAVGDDWQSINRFAGADLSVMRGFTDAFGAGPQLALTKTFRCTQSVCDVSRSFIVKNKNQFDKAMSSAQGAAGWPVHIIATEEPSRELRELLLRLAAERRGAPALSVDVLGRYSFDGDVLPDRRFAGIDLTFRTVHGSKGLEADVIVVPKMVKGTYGFPSMIIDDPVLSLAMPEAEQYPHAEERRLFYVALTRARQRVFILTDPSRASPFVLELLHDHKDTGLVTSEGFEDSEDGVPPPCPRTRASTNRCNGGVVVKRISEHGEFRGCSTFPRCHFKPSPCRKCRQGWLYVFLDGEEDGLLGCSNPPCGNKMKGPD